MKQALICVNDQDPDGNPAGGYVKGLGIRIAWQNGPLGRGENRVEPNGAFVEGVIQAALQRLKVYQESTFECHENKRAIESLEESLRWLEHRTQAREARGVEGTNKP